VFSLEAHAVPDARAGPDEDDVEAIPLMQLRERYVDAHARVVHEAHAHVAQRLELLLQDLLAHLEVRDAVAKHPARLGPEVVDRAVVPARLQLLRNRETGRAAANDRRPPPR